MARRLERHYRDMQDIEFTIEHGKLFILQTRTGKRTAQACVRLAMEMANEGIISREEAVMRVDPTQLNQLLLPSFDPQDKERARKEGKLIATGLNASPGAAIGQIVFEPHEAEKLALQNEKVIIWLESKTCPDDIHGIVPAQGVVTSRGGMTSHAAVVARGMGKPCVAGCEALKIDLSRKNSPAATPPSARETLFPLTGPQARFSREQLPPMNPSSLLSSRPCFSGLIKHVY